MAAASRAKLSHLTAALTGPDSTEAHEASRALIDEVSICLATDEGDPRGIVLVCVFLNLLQAAGGVTKTAEEATTLTAILGLMHSSANEGPGSRPMEDRLLVNSARRGSRLP